jgi:hypothetical protein
MLWSEETQSTPVSLSFRINPIDFKGSYPCDRKREDMLNQIKDQASQIKNLMQKLENYSSQSLHNRPSARQRWPTILTRKIITMQEADNLFRMSVVHSSKI